MAYANWQGGPTFLSNYSKSGKGESCKKEVVLFEFDEGKKENQNYLWVSEMDCYGFFIFQIDSSLNLQIIRSDISIYNGIILWSKENVDEEKFKKAISVVSIFYGVKF